jgi:hypothetical protein
MKTIALGAVAAAVLGSAAVAAPLGPTAIGSTEARHRPGPLVCDEYGRCYRTRGPATSSATTAMMTGTWCAAATAPTEGRVITTAATATTAVARASVSASAPGTGKQGGKGRSPSGPFRAAATSIKRPN